MNGPRRDPGRPGKPGYHIQTARFVLRTLELQDATPRYADWFRDPTVRRYIAAAKQPQSVATLRAYIAEKRRSPVAELFGIFLRENGTHIGNIKFEPINEGTSAAVVGVLIGESTWRGKGVFAEAFLGASDFLRERRGILHFWLGVERIHSNALAGYRKAGFLPGEPPTNLIPMRRADSVYLCCAKK